MPIRTWLAGGPMDGQNVCADSPPELEVDGLRYRHATGPYYPGGRAPFQIYVFADLDAAAAAAALRRLMGQGALNAPDCDDHDVHAPAERQHPDRGA